MAVKHLQRPFAVKSTSDNGTFAGHASVFGEIDSYRDIVLPGAFAKSLKKDFADKGRKVPMLWQHSSRQPIGVYTTIKEDDIGLYVEGEINMEVQQGREAYALMKQGALSGLSIGYDTVTEEWDKEGRLRKLHEVDLWEISPVTFPAGDSARIATVKSISELTTLSQVEDILCDTGLSRKEAVTLISRIKAIGTQSDSADADAAKLKQALSIIKSIKL